PTVGATHGSATSGDDDWRTPGCALRSCPGRTDVAAPFHPQRSALRRLDPHHGVRVPDGFDFRLAAAQRHAAVGVTGNPVRALFRDHRSAARRASYASGVHELLLGMGSARYCPWDTGNAAVLLAGLRAHSAGA